MPDPSGSGGRVTRACESNAAAARKGLWDALDTLHCGQPDVVRGFLEDLPPDLRLIDVGCWNGSIAELAVDCVGGTGTAAGRSARAPWRLYVAIDLVPEAVARFRTRHRNRPRTHAVVADIRALPLPDQAADALICLFVLQDMEGYRPDGLRALGELARIARPGCRALLGLTVHASREEETSYVVRALRPAGIPEKPTHHWRRADFLEAVTRSGFEAVRIDEFGPNDRGFVELYVRGVRGALPRGRGSGPKVAGTGRDRPW